MATFACFPPTTTLSNTRIPPSAALAHLSDYLVRSKEDVSLLPNTQLTESGPAVGSSSTHGGVLIHNLKRVQAGLKGEYLAAAVEDDDPDPRSGDINHLPTGDEDAQYGGLNKKRKVADKRDSSLTQSQGNEGNDVIRLNSLEQQQQLGGESVWQDKEEYEQSQAVEQGEIGRRSNAVTAARGASSQPPVIGITDESTAKEERKRKKKERKKEEQRAKEAKRKHMADEDRTKELGEDEALAARMTVDGKNDEVDDAVRANTTQATTEKEEMRKKKGKRRKGTEE